MKVLVVYGSESGTCKRIANTLAKDWASRSGDAFEIAHVCDGASVLGQMSVMEDDNNVIHYDLTSLRSKFDVLLIITSSYGEGDPPDNFGPFFLELLAKAESGARPLAGMQHAVLGQGSTVYQETFQNMPRLTDRYLGECGSRRFVMRQEVDAAHYIEGDQHVRDRDHWREAVFSALQALPAASAPAVCGWEEARCSHSFPTNKVTPKTADDLAQFRGRAGASGSTNEQAFGMVVWGALLWAAIGYGYYVRSQSSES
jgi:sulfite reductase alpha subunit-like flavoprotein